MEKTQRGLVGMGLGALVLVVGLGTRSFAPPGAWVPGTVVSKVALDPCTLFEQNEVDLDMDDEATGFDIPGKASLRAIPNRYGMDWTRTDLEAGKVVGSVRTTNGVKPRHYDELDDNAKVGCIKMVYGTSANADRAFFYLKGSNTGRPLSNVLFCQRSHGKKA